MGYNSEFLAQSASQGYVACQATMKTELGVENIAGMTGQSQLASIQGANGAVTDREVAEHGA